MQQAIQTLLDGKSLDAPSAARVMGAIMAGEASEAQIGALLVLLRQRGETVDEIVGFVRAMRERAVRVLPPPGIVLDTCGTGGDAAGTLNISTLAALVAAAAGVRVAKHGNRSASGRVGSADLLEALGLRLDLGPDGIATLLQDTGFGFLFAPRHHPAMRHAASARRALGVRTVFNLLGPLTNPAGATHQLLGLCDGQLAIQFATVLRDLGCERALVVHGEDGTDEISTAAPTAVVELQDGRLQHSVWRPEDFGVPRSGLASLSGGDLSTNVAIARSVLRGEPGPCLDAVALNAGAALYLTGAASDVGAGVVAARELLHSGRVQQKLDAIVTAARRLPAAEAT
ncbi:MAG TPA: anthranilate phosphoribosyltransferase [Candidatus Krumholzibacteria bacterium]|nr:anthranilate phosphoribosyltransferase [Candidatus Krumholzibacteria bacterium]